jgi:predicted metal-dependent phosphotriesterase family hydrolase
MSQVPTVRGPVEAADLGRTYMHEHIFVLAPDVQQNYPGEWASEEDRGPWPAVHGVVAQRVASRKGIE